MKVVALLSFLSITLAFAPSSSSRSRGGTVVVQESQVCKVHDLRTNKLEMRCLVSVFSPIPPAYVGTGRPQGTSQKVESSCPVL
jgi:hypothetical protein